MTLFSMSTRNRRINGYKYARVFIRLGHLDFMIRGAFQVGLFVINDMTRLGVIREIESDGRRSEHEAAPLK